MANLRRRVVLPSIPVRGIVIFPNMILHFDVARKPSIEALEAAMAGNQQIFLATQKDITVETPQPSDVYKMGTVAKVKQLLKLPGNMVRVLVEGMYRANCVEYLSTEPYYLCDVMECKSIRRKIDSIEEEALRRMVSDIWTEYEILNPKVSSELLMSIENMDSLSQYADSVASGFLQKIEDKQSILEELNIYKRLHLLIEKMNKEFELIKTEREIMVKVKENMDRNQKEYFLREQAKAISKELGDDKEANEEYREKISASKMPEEVKSKAMKELSHLERMQSSSPEANVIRNYLDTLTDLPFGNYTKENNSIKKAEKILNEDHYGLKSVKERILEYLAVGILKGNHSGQILCLVGPPGVGKTSIAKSVANACGRNYARISLGGISDEAEIRGHRKTYIGSMPGRIINAIRQAGSMNALVLLDEVDKLGRDYKGDPSSALLEVLDSAQNFAFRDHYIEVPFDLSKVMFITTANTAETIPRPLLDRMELIELGGYTFEEKEQIAIRHLIPKVYEETGISSETLKINKAAISDTIIYYTREAGVRQLEREMRRICRKAASKLISGEEKISVTSKNLDMFLGRKKYRLETLSGLEETGVVRGLAWTSAGGDTLSIEVNVCEGKGNIELTGHLGDIMKESAKAAISYVRANASSLGISTDFYKGTDIHIHVPDGAVPKDGPSAGITLCTALVSALTGREVPSDLAMTGEITIRGRVLPVGGIREKVLAAFMFGVKKIIMPAENQKDLEDVPESIRSAIKFVFVENMNKVISEALLPLRNDYLPPIIPNIECSNSLKIEQ